MTSSIWLNLGLRLILAAYVVWQQTGQGGDTGYYLSAAQNVCDGNWGGDMFRAPGIAWFLCLFKPSVGTFVQTTLLWLAGVLLIRRTGNQKIGLLWLFDPVLLAMSLMLMSDALFGLSVLFLGVSMQDVLLNRDKKSVKAAAYVGVAIAACTLVRVIGVFLGAFCLLTLLVLTLRKSLPLRKTAVALGVALLLLFPKIYWNGTHYGHWKLTLQGEHWINTVAAMVENHGSGLDPYQTEVKFLSERPHPEPGIGYRIILQHFPVWLFLTAKGVARVLIGHLNVEWTQLIAGFVPIGPGWFSVVSHLPGAHVKGIWLIPWTLGVVSFATFCLWVYFLTFKSVRQAGLDVFSVWALGSIALLALVPQVWGDARFRTGVWPLVLLLWSWAEKRRAQQLQVDANFKGIQER